MKTCGSVNPPEGAERFCLSSTPVKNQGNLSPGDWLKVAPWLQSCSSEWARSCFTHCPETIRQARRGREHREECTSANSPQCWDRATAN